MSPQRPAAFLSYVHEDDRYGHVTTFRERLTDEVQMAIGGEFNIFQDRNDIHWGQNWKQRIEGSLDEVTFLIPVITPRFFNSPHCRAELQRFLERERRLGRADLILPLYYIDTPLLNDDRLRAADELAQAIASRQYADWRDLRWEPFTNPQVGRTLERLARQIRDALPRIQPTAPLRASVETPATPLPANESSERSPERPAPKNEPPTCTVHPMPHRGDFTTISGAIEKSAAGTKIIVRPGFYQEGLVIDKPLEIIGEGEPGEVVIQASGKNAILFQTDMGRVVNLTLRQAGGGEWYAVNIAQGRLELEDCDITSKSLACVIIRDGADPRLRRNRIHDSKVSGVRIDGNGLGTLEDNDIFGNTLSGVQVRSGSNPTLRRNRIHDNKAAGVLTLEDALGTLEDNDIFGNALSGVEIIKGSSPTLRRNSIRDGNQVGVLVDQRGLGTLEGNDIFGNVRVGVEVRQGGRPILRNNRIYKNGYQAIRVHDGGGGTFEGNDLRDNERGAWDIAADCKANVKRSNNQE